MRKRDWTAQVGEPAVDAVALTSWSISRLKDWERCPQYAKFRHGLKLPEPKGEALARGIAVHAEAEAYLTAAKAPRTLPESLSRFTPQFRELRRRGALAEVKFAFNASWEMRDFFAKDAWGRAVADALVVSGARARIVDFKTGKKRDGYEDQLELYALVVLLAYAGVEEVSCELWYLDSGDMVKSKFKRCQLEALIAGWTLRPLPMLEDRIFPSRPGWYCRWCHYRKDNAGPCEH